jgi:xylose isomerase
MADIFPEIKQIKYEGPDSRNPLAFRWYQADEKVGGKTMKEHLRFSMAYWHTMCGGGSDPFGGDTMLRPWNTETDPMKKAEQRMRGIFELTTKLGIPFYCFHDRDIAPEGKNLSETNANLDKIVALAKQLQKDTGIKLLWGTTNAFSNPRFAQGASTSPNAEVFAYTAAQVKKAMEVTKELGGENYVFWGGREGYETLLNTNMQFELENMARFMHMAVDYAKKIGFTGQFLIEPKPKEPTKHQYDFDSQSVYGFLIKNGLEKHFKMNIETNHATLAGHTVQHELHWARVNGVLGSVDANMGDLLLGWDTDQFPTDLYITSGMMLEILKNGGLGKGGLNFDAKPRRPSHTPEDIAMAHIAGMDAFARGLKIAQKIIDDKQLDAFVEKRYASYKSGIGADIVAGKVGFEELEKYALAHEPKLESGRQEMLEALYNTYI